jgi:hypothetical protein
MAKKKTSSAVVSGALLDDIRDASRYRHLRQTAYRSHTGKGTGKRYKVEMHFVAQQRDQWPDQHAFCDFDSAVDEAMSSNDQAQRRRRSLTPEFASDMARRHSSAPFCSADVPGRSKTRNPLRGR